MWTEGSSNVLGQLWRSGNPGYMDKLEFRLDRSKKGNDFMNKTTCPIWGTPAFEAPNDGRHGRIVDSPRTGGEYFVTGSAEPSLKDCEDTFKIRLTSWLVEQRGLGNPCPEIHTGTISEARQRRELRISERVDGILRYLEMRCNTLGTLVCYRVFSNLYATTVLDDLDREYFGLLSHSGCLGGNDLIFLLNYLGQRGLIENTGRNDEIKGCTLTVEGYARLDEIRENDTDSSKAFVAMWFDNSMNDAWKQGFGPAICDAGYEPFRVDKKEHINRIDDEIIAEIRRARFVVADFTHGDDGARGGVYYEAGFARGLGIPVIFTCLDKVFGNIHFDTRQFNHIVWKHPEELRAMLRNRIAAVIGDGPGEVSTAKKPDGN